MLIVNGNELAKRLAHQTLGDILKAKHGPKVIAQLYATTKPVSAFKRAPKKSAFSI